ncbi:MAG TPA: hypothetical protein VF190_14770 [Rhodothermales bacterium]|jgi:hypothetical protein
MIRERRSSPLQRAPSSADVGIFALAWLLIALAPDVTTSNGVCKDLEGFDAFYVFVFGSAVVGGVAWERPAFAATRAMRARLVSYAAVAIVIPYAIVVRAVFATACTWN